jgi:hypothetical protein
MESKFKLPTETITLPSKGLLYPKDNPLSKGEVEMSYMTAKHEDILTNMNYIKNGTAIDKLLEALVVSPINFNDLLVGDKNAILIAARILGYGKDYSFKYKGEKVTVDLTECPSRYLDESQVTPGVNEFSYTLPTSNAKITYKILTNKDEKEIQAELDGYKKLNKDFTPELSTRLKYVIQSVNGNTDKKAIREFVDNYMLARDSKAFRDHLVATQPDIIMEANITLSDGTEEGVNIPVTINFFWPDA